MAMPKQEVPSETMLYSRTLQDDTSTFTADRGNRREVPISSKTFDGGNKIDVLKTSQDDNSILVSDGRNTQCQILKSFILEDIDHISGIATLDEKSAFIKDNARKRIWSFSTQDDNRTTYRVVTFYFSDIAVNSTNDLLLTDLDNSTVKLLTESGEIKTVANLKPLEPITIDVTQDNDIIVGVTESNDTLGCTYTITDQSQRAVIVLGADGKVKHRYQYDGNRQRLFTYPYKITTNRNQDILITDGISSDTGRVVCIEGVGNIRWIYTGNPEINTTVPFDPRGIVTTPDSNTVISDYKTHVLHVLSKDGDALTCIALNDMEIMNPWALDIDKGGNLWIGCGRSGGIHIVKLNL